MFNVGGGEILVILLVALLVLGPNKLPEASRQIGRGLAELRRMSSGFQRELREAMHDVDETNKQADTDRSGPRLPPADTTPTTEPASEPVADAEPDRVDEPVADAEPNGADEHGLPPPPRAAAPGSERSGSGS